MHYKKIYNIAIFITSLIVFVTWPLVSDINLSSFFGDYQFIPKFLINFIFAYGSFHFFVSLIVNLLEKIPGIKKIVLGSSYFEGTWIGYYVAHDEKSVLFVQTVEQNIDDIIITSSEAYHIDKSYRCMWHSVNKVSVDPKSSSLSYLYETSTVVNSTNSVENRQRAFGHFTSNYLKKGFFKNPYRINGYAFNTVSKTEIRVVQIKETDKILINSPNDISKLLNSALELYKAETQR